MSEPVVIDRPQALAAGSATPLARIEDVFAAQRAAFAREMNPSLGVRRDRLDFIVSSNWGHVFFHST